MNNQSASKNHNSSNRALFKQSYPQYLYQYDYEKTGIATEFLAHRPEHLVAKIHKNEVEP